MILSNRSRVLTSEPFGFLVDKNKTSFILHSDALVGQSDPLLALINGGVVEAREGHAWLEDTEFSINHLFRYASTRLSLTLAPSLRCSC